MAGTTTDMSELQSAALRYIEQGFHPVPIPADKKGAVLPDWPNLRIGKDDVPRYFAATGTENTS